MNLDQSPTIEQLKQLMATANDAEQSHVLYVDKQGTVHLDIFGNDSLANAGYTDERTLQFILDTFMIGEGCTGEAASQDQDWMNELFYSLNEHWGSKTTGFAKEQ